MKIMNFRGVLMSAVQSGEFWGVTNNVEQIQWSTLGEQAAWNGVLWGSAGALLSCDASWIAATAGLGVTEQLVEECLSRRLPTKWRRICPIVAASLVSGAFLATSPYRASTITAAVYLTTLALAVPKSFLNKPYPEIMPLLSSAAAKVSNLASKIPGFGYFMSHHKKTE
jgi:hypothetical protein